MHAVHYHRPSAVLRVYICFPLHKLSRDLYALQMARICFSSSLVGRLALLLLAACHSSFAQQEGDWTSYSSAWDFANASSKLDAVSQAQNSALLSLFNPDMPPAVGAESQVGIRDRELAMILVIAIFLVRVPGVLSRFRAAGLYCRRSCLRRHNCSTTGLKLRVSLSRQAKRCAITLDLRSVYTSVTSVYTQGYAQEWLRQQLHGWVKKSSNRPFRA